MRKLTLIIITIKFCLSVNAQFDNLEPEPGFFSSAPYSDTYYLKVKKVLIDPIPHLPYASIIVMPSFSLEYIVSIDYYADTKTYLTYRIARQQIWTNQTKDTIECENYKIEFDKSLALKMNELFFIATSKAKYPDNPNSGTDGTRYIFVTFRAPFGSRSGTTWSPDGEKMFGLVEISEWLINCSKNGEIIDQDKMTGKINALIDKFKNE
jgi:hypothetical protein